MYVIPGLLTCLCVLFLLLSAAFWRCRRIRRIVCRMAPDEKQTSLNEQIRPFGFLYDGCRDVFSSEMDAWQRDFGYCAFFDEIAPRFGIICDCLPVYFDFCGRTWLIEFWKGQYGINTGAEIGVYYADRMLSPDEYGSALFQAVPNELMLPLQMELRYRGVPLLSACGTHWWLTGFRMGKFSFPEELALKATITFPDDEMRERFLCALSRISDGIQNLSVCKKTVTFLFTSSGSGRWSLLTPYRAWVQWKNRIFVKLYLWITHPFDTAADRLLYLYYLLPFAFRRCAGTRRELRKRRRP